MSAIVCRVGTLRPHPDADRLVCLELLVPNAPVLAPLGIVDVVTGPHYEEGQRGVWIAPGSVIPGWLAEDLWMSGTASANRWMDIGPREVRGIMSFGTFAGERWRTAPDRPWNSWPFWRKHWKDGDDVSAFLGLRS